MINLVFFLVFVDNYDVRLILEDSLELGVGKICGYIYRLFFLVYYCELEFFSFFIIGLSLIFVWINEWECGSEWYFKVVW